MTQPTTMDSRARVRAALDHREPDRIPRDLAGTRYSSIHANAYRALRPALGLEPREPVVVDLSQGLALVEDDVLDRLGADVRGIGPRTPSGWRREIVRDGAYERFVDEWGVQRTRPVDGGLYFEATSAPLSGEISDADIAGFAWPDPVDAGRFAGLADDARRYAREERRAVVCGSVCAGITEMLFRLRGYEDAYLDLAAEPERALAVMERILELKLAWWDRALDVLGDDVDVVAEADDLGAQQALLFSPETYRRLVKPLHAQLFAFLHARTKAKVFLHSCGAIRELLPDLIEIGVDILNPVQVSATGMETAALKRDFGADLVFWGGAVDSQKTLGRGTPNEVEAEARRRIGDLSPGGGFVFASIHNIQANVPPDNIVALWRAVGGIA
ncbi:MAG: uroporphyrinogen decarboxylase family protein [Chloroflexota bacterium]